MAKSEQPTWINHAAPLPISDHPEQNTPPYAGKIGKKQPLSSKRDSHRQDNKKPAKSLSLLAGARQKGRGTRF
jgi:hypothetical protein